MKGQDCTAESQRTNSKDDNNGGEAPPVVTKSGADSVASTPSAPDNPEAVEEDDYSLPSAKAKHSPKSAEQPEVSAIDHPDTPGSCDQFKTDTPRQSDTPGQPAMSAVPEQPVKSAAPPTQQQEPSAKDPGSKAAGGWGGWGGWGGSLWSSVSSVAESAQAIGQKVKCLV